MNTDTIITITEIKNGHATGKSYEITAGQFIAIVKNKDCDGSLDVDVEPIYDEDGDIEEYTADKFYELPVSEQLDMCCKCEGDALAASVTYEISAKE